MQLPMKLADVFVLFATLRVLVLCTWSYIMYYNGSTTTTTTTTTTTLRIRIDVESVII